MMEEKKIIVSLTSFPARINIVHLAINRIFKNDVQPDMIVLYLARPQFPNELDNVSGELQQMVKENNRFEIRFVERDTRPYKKLVHALRDFPNDIVITIDDDTLYRRNLIKQLVASHKKNPNSIIVRRARFITFNKKGSLKPYRKWPLNGLLNHCRMIGKPNFRNFIIGAALYPPYCFCDEVFNEQVYMDICETTDDIWFWAMAVKNGTKIASSRPYAWQRKIKGTQKVALRNVNYRTQNDINMQRVLEKYPSVAGKIRNQY